MKKNISFLLFVILALAISENNVAQIISTIAGNGTAGFSGNGSAATLAKLNNPTGITYDSIGNIYISDYNNNQIRKIDGSGTITTVAGTGVGGYSGDGGSATAAKLNLPSTLTFDKYGNMYVVDALNNCVRKVTPSGIISTFAGNGLGGYSGDGGLASSAQLNFPCGIYIDAIGNVFIADRNNHRIRKVNTSGFISTFAGTGVAGFSGDGAVATNAKLNMPNSIYFDNSGNAYIADAYNNRIRKVNASGIISTFAGTGIGGFSGDGGQAISAQLNQPFGISFDAAGNSYISDFNNHRIRKIDQGGIISTLAGTGVGGYSGDGGVSNVAKIYYPEKVTIDATGNIYIPDAGNQRVRKISCAQPTITIASSNTLICAGESVLLTAGGSSLYSWNLGNTTNNISVSPSVTTTYTVIGTDMQTGCRNSATITQSVSACIGLHELSSKNNFKIYPNPSKGKFTLYTNGEKQTLQIFNSVGSLIYFSIIENEKTEIDLSHHASGVYLVRFDTLCMKIIKEE